MSDKTVNSTLRLDPVTDRAVKMYAGDHGLTKSEALRLLIQADLLRDGYMDRARKAITPSA